MGSSSTPARRFDVSAAVLVHHVVSKRGGWEEEGLIRELPVERPWIQQPLSAIAVAAVFLLILIVWFFSTWNRLINLDENAQNAWNNIDVLLNQRYDMIPNMVSIVKGYAEHEAGIFDQFARLAKPLLVR